MKINYLNIVFIFLLLGSSLQSMAQNDGYMDKGQLEVENALIEAKKEALIGHNKEAIALLKKILIKNKDNAVAHYELARIYKIENQNPEAIKHAVLSTQYDNNNKWYWLQLSSLYKFDKNYEKSIETYQKLQELDGFNIHYTLGECNAWMKLSKHKKALKTLQKYKDETKHFSPQIARKTMSIYRRVNKPKKEEAAIQSAITEEPHNVDWKIKLAKFYKRQGDENKSQYVYANILKHNPTNIQAAYAIAKKDDNKENINSLNLIISNVAYDVRRKVKLLFPHLQRLLDNPKNENLANQLIRYGTKLTELHKDNSISWAFLADVQQQTNMISSALDNYKIALKLNKSIYTVWEQALRLMSEEKHYHDLQTYSESAMEYYPNKPYIYFSNGLANMHLGQLKMAEKMAKESLLMSSRNKIQKANSYNLLALIYFKNSYSLETYPQIKNTDVYLKSLSQLEKAIQLNKSAPKLMDDLAFILAHKPDNIENAKLSIEGKKFEELKADDYLPQLQNQRNTPPKLNHTLGVIKFNNNEYSSVITILEKDLDVSNDFYGERISLLLKSSEYLNDQIKISYYTKKLHNLQ